MSNAKGWGGLWAACVAAGLALTGAGVAQVNPEIAPMPRPVAVAAATPAPQTTTPAVTPTAPATAPEAQTSLPATQAEDDRGASERAEGNRVGSVTGFPIPRYVSIKASEANARRGPSRSHRIDWVFQRRNMPVMVVAEHGHWRRVVDRDGAGGWVHYTLLSGERTAIVEQDRLPLYQRPDRGSMVRAEAELGVIGALRECRLDWCEMEVGGYRGWVEVRGIWGVSPGETFD